MTPIDKQAEYKLARPPVIEAVIDFATTPITLSELDELFIPLINDSFPQREVIHSFEAEINVGEATSSSFRNHFLGYMFKAEDKQIVLQSRLNGFGFSVLQPYSDWNAFLDQAMTWWNVYKTARPKAEIVRLGLRYINSIKLPNGLKAADAFDLCVSFPDESSVGEVKAFSYNYSTENRELGAGINVHFLQQGAIGADPSYILDIDVMRPMSDASLSDDQIVETLASLREIKNSIFFGTLNPRLLETFT